MIVRLLELTTLRNLKYLKLVAGQGGLNEIVRWVHVSDVPDATQWVQSGELLFITGIGIKNNTGDLLELVKKGAAKKLAGLVINVGPYIEKTPQEIIDLADHLCFPVFELPWKVKLAEVTKSICAYIVEKQSEEKSIRDLFENILYGDTKYLPMLVIRAAHYGYDLTLPHQIMLLKIDNFATYLDQIGVKNEGRIINVKTNKQKIIEKSLARYEPKALYDMRLDSVVIMLPAGNKATEERTDKIAYELRIELEGLLPGTSVSIGIGSPQEKPEQIRQSLDQAKFALETARVYTNEDKIYRYDQLGLFKLLFKIDRAELESYFQEVLSSLVQYNREHEGDLINTLSHVLEAGGNYNSIADRLYVHRNTLKNRVKKIEALTGCKLSNPRDLVKLEFALLAKKFLGL
ncbi:MAG: PucR family transcriptional regulator ligand-binding domain-containing protein [Negativicutes bacterium]|nr:PucR family transcriptional regulator ligand-binding domain-containing protein [Negativicutes bacterium]